MYVQFTYMCGGSLNRLLLAYVLTWSGEYIANGLNGFTATRNVPIYVYDTKVLKSRTKKKLVVLTYMWSRL